jgi:ribosome-associated toxin RatA of RatAB toxin-antitoxin module
MSLRRSATLLTTGVLLLMVRPAAADLMSEVRAGKIISVSLPTGKGVLPGRAMGLINAPADVVREILAGFDAYDTFVPRITGSRRVKAGSFVVESKFPWPVSRAWAYIKVSEKSQQDGTHFLRWRMVNGTLKQYHGMAWIQPMGKDKSVLTYQMLVVPKTVAPNGLLTRGVRTAVKKMVQAVRKQAAKVMAQRPVQGVRVAAQ